LETVFFNPVSKRRLDVIGFVYIIWSSSLAEISSLTKCENEVTTSLLAKVSGSLTGYENEVRASLLAKVSDSLKIYAFVVFKR
jgi:hypothetical protein